MKITIATPDDSLALSELLVMLMEQEADFKPQKEIHQKGILMIIEQPAMGTILCLKDKEKLLGMIAILYSISTAIGAKVATFEDFIIHPHYRGQGYGKQLFAQAIKTAQEAQCKRVTLLTDSDNNPAHAFYRRYGMEASAMVPYRLSL